MTTKLPAARTANIVMQELNGELLIADLNDNRVHRLNQTLGIVYRACDGKTTFDELRKRYNFPEELIALALAELEKENLLGSGNRKDSAAVSRRELIKRAGLATMIALPIISSLTMPAAADAASGINASVPFTGGSCPTGYYPIPQSEGGGGGNGDFCTCPSPTPLGGSCSRGDITNTARCRTGCTCTVTEVSGDLRMGRCG